MLPMLIMAGASLMSGIASSKALDEKSQQARIAAVRRRLKAGQDARDIEEHGERFQASQAAGFAKSGVLLDSGSPLATLMDTAIHVERNAMRARLQGEYESEGFESEASAYKTMSKGAIVSGISGAAGSFVTGSKMSQGAYKPSGGVTEEPWMKTYGND